MYTVTPRAPKNVTDLGAWTERQLSAVARAQSETWDLPVTTVAPPRPKPGMIRFADGTEWDPGSGEGLYVFKSTGWALL